MSKVKMSKVKMRKIKKATTFYNAAAFLLLYPMIFLIDILSTYK
jgi:hypothetical protein